MITGGWLGTLDPKTGRGEPTAESIRANLEEAWAVLPMLRDVTVEFMAADRFEAITADALPVLDRLPGVSNLIVGAGFSGQGYAPAPAYVELLAEWLLDGAKPPALEPFGYKP
jgi:glycine/D-amino acid oxidase-like deaminating enzyme